MRGPVAVVGGGAGGRAAAWYLARAGADVRLYSRSAGTLGPLLVRPTLVVEAPEGAERVDLALASQDLGAVLRGARLAVVTVPGSGHQDLAPHLLHRLEPGARLLLLPGWLGASLWWARRLREAGRPDVMVAETNTLPFLARATAPGTVTVFRVLRRVYFCTIPAEAAASVREELSPLLPMLHTVESVLQTGLTNFNPVVHPPGMLLNAGRIEDTGGRFGFYREGMTRAVGLVMEAIDQERRRVQRALGLREIRFVDYFYQAGYVEDRSPQESGIREAILSSPANQRMAAPANLAHRFLDEDVAYGLVPLVRLGRGCGLPLPVTRSVVQLASVVRGRNYWREGPSLADLGLEGRDAEGIRAIAAGAWQS